METKEQLIIVRDLSGLQSLVEYVKDKEYLTFDTETTGLEKDSTIIGMSTCAELDKAFYVITDYWDPATQSLKSLPTKDACRELLKELLKHNLIMHNGGYDCWMVNNNYKIDLMPALHTDTMILGHLLNENRRNGLKERAIELYGDTSAEEQRLMKESVIRNGGVLTKANFELYKADSDLIAKYGAKDALLTLKLFYNDIPQLYDQGLDKFFYEDESMPLLRGPTYDLNTTGLRVDPDKLSALKATLEAEIAEGEAYIYKEVDAYVKKQYPGDKKSNTFNVNSAQQLAWLLFECLGEEFSILTDAGKEVCKELGLNTPYTAKAKREFIQACKDRKEEIWRPGYVNPDTGKKKLAKKVMDPWKYMAVGADSLERLSKKYKWVERLLKYKQDAKLLGTYVLAIQDKMKYNIIRPQFLQIGTTSGRYSSKNPNLQNLPRDDKRVKECLIARPGKVFVGADQSQLEPRCFASSSGDDRLLKCFQEGDDFYSVIGVETFGKYGYSLKKDEPGSFAKSFPELRQIAKVICLAATYGANAHRLAKITGKSIKEMEEILESYFTGFPKVRQLMLTSHKEAIDKGQVVNAYGRPRRIPAARDIPKIYGKLGHDELPYEVRSILNLSVNHKVQSTGASIMNRCMVRIWNDIQLLSTEDSRWKEVKIVLQVHDSLMLEGPEELAEEMKCILQHGLENTVILPGVKLVAEPSVSYSVAGQK